MFGSLYRGSKQGPPVYFKNVKFRLLLIPLIICELWRSRAILRTKPIRLKHTLARAKIYIVFKCQATVVSLPQVLYVGDASNCCAIQCVIIDVSQPSSEGHDVTLFSITEQHVYNALLIKGTLLFNRLTKDRFSIRNSTVCLFFVLNTKK